MPDDDFARLASAGLRRLVMRREDLGELRCAVETMKSSHTRQKGLTESKFVLIAVEHGYKARANLAKLLRNVVRQNLSAHF